MSIVHICRGISAWIVIVAVGLTILVKKDNNDNLENKKFYRFGPHDDLVLLGFVIDNGYKYALVVIYSAVNTIVRTIQQEVLSPWLVNMVQDLERKQTPKTRRIAYEVTSINTLYQWIDWLLYMNILLSQIDMVLIEIFMNLIASNVSTYIYIKNNKSSYIEL